MLRGWTDLVSGSHETGQRKAPARPRGTGETRWKSASFCGCFQASMHGLPGARRFQHGIQGVNPDHNPRGNTDIKPGTMHQIHRHQRGLRAVWREVLTPGPRR